MVMEEAMDSEMSLSNMVLGFLEDAGRERWPENNGDDDDGASGGGDAESKAFWQAQHSELHEALAKSSPAESRIRADTEDAIKNMRAAAGAACSCTGRPSAGDCRRCMLRHVAERLRDAGYNSALCKSKWTRSPDIPSEVTTPTCRVHINQGNCTTFAQNIPKSAPDIRRRTARFAPQVRRAPDWPIGTDVCVSAGTCAGEHSYVDVVVQTRSGKAVRVVVELSFRAEFEVARAGAEYRALVGALPEVYVGRADRLRAVIKVMCAAAKQCMKENNMHMGPWRKHKYMQSKWLGTTERTVAAAPAVPAAVVKLGLPEKQTKFRASILSFDFGRTAVEVV